VVILGASVDGVLFELSQAVVPSTPNCTVKTPRHSGVRSTVRAGRFDITARFSTPWSAKSLP
jgi:hypothetical protein